MSLAAAVSALPWTARCGPRCGPCLTRRASLSWSGPGSTATLGASATPLTPAPAGADVPDTDAVAALDVAGLTAGAGAR